MLGGGIVRIRPDGTEMEIYNHGTRNVYDLAIDPLMNIYSRGNTNDGGGWNIRFSHQIQSAEYGYPVLFKHFTEEIVPAMVDLGGGEQGEHGEQGEQGQPGGHQRRPVGRQRHQPHRRRDPPPAPATAPQPAVGRSRPRDSQVTSSAVPTMPSGLPTSWRMSASRWINCPPMCSAATTMRGGCPRSSPGRCRSPCPTRRRPTRRRSDVLNGSLHVQGERACSRNSVPKPWPECLPRPRPPSRPPKRVSSSGAIPI